jgi:hypothetical protein
VGFRGGGNALKETVLLLSVNEPQFLDCTARSLVTVQITLFGSSQNFGAQVVWYGITCILINGQVVLSQLQHAPLTRVDKWKCL